MIPTTFFKAEIPRTDHNGTRNPEPVLTDHKFLKAVVVRLCKIARRRNRKVGARGS